MRSRSVLLTSLAAAGLLVAMRSSADPVGQGATPLAQRDGPAQARGGARGPHTIDVSGPDALDRALDKARDGDVLALGPGDYGNVAIRGRMYAQPITITSRDPRQRASIQNLQLQKVDGVNVRGVDIRVQAGGKGVEVGTSSNVRLEDLDVQGVITDTPKGNGSGVYVRDSQHVTVTKCEFHNLTQGLTHLENDGITFTDNYFHDLRIDGIRGGGSSNVDISRNYFTEFHRSPGDHPDAIQFWTTNVKHQTHDFTIKDNLFVRGGGTPAQGVFMGNEWNMAYNNVEIANNIIYGGMPNGISIGSGRDVNIHDNLVLGFTDMASKIRIEKSDRVMVRENATSHFVLAKNGDDFQMKGNKKLFQPNVDDTKVLSQWLQRRVQAQGALPWPADRYMKR